THHAVKTHRGEKECDTTENREQADDDAIAGKTFVVQSSGCAWKINRHIRIKLSNRSSQRRTERFRLLARARSNDNRAKLGRWRRAKERHIKAGGVGLLIERPLHQSVGNDAYDHSPRLRLTRVENADLMSERALIAQMLPRKTCVHDRDRLLCVRIID